MGDLSGMGKMNTLDTSQLSRHDLLVQLVRAREERLLDGGVLNADAIATLIEEVLDLAGAR